LDAGVREIPARPVVGVLHPGLMGAAIGSALKARAGGVIWADAGRSDATAKRAEIADLIAVPDVAEVARRADVIVSICPPHAALSVATEVAAAVADREPPLYVEANAVSPDTVTAVAELLGPDNVVDGAVIGPPGWERGTTVLWLAGERAQVAAELFAGSPFDARVLGPRLGAASALKACFALQSKAIPAAWLALFAAARTYGVEAALQAELDRDGVAPSRPMSEVGARAAQVAWRWAGEMDEAAAAFAAAGLPGGFSAAAGEVYRRIAGADPDERRDVWGITTP
jgi:3-hydroxyisobutyrate dehydrogenase-like beta-hydroxyacid dehydrogenase